MIQTSLPDSQPSTKSSTNFESAQAYVDPAFLVNGIACVDPHNQRLQDQNDENLLLVSPYLAHEHLLDLRALQVNQQLLARALTCLQNIRPDYATCSYNLAFNWSLVVDNLRSLTRAANYPWVTQHFYIVVFRSQIPPTTNRVHLADLDRRSHIEATESGGLLKYWFGVPDGEGRNLATCIWRRQGDARPGSTGAAHRAAMRATMSMYTEWKVERLKLVIKKGAQERVGDWHIVPWQEGDEPPKA